MPMISSVSIHGLQNIRWEKYGWKSASDPTIFILVGTPKETQNAVIFLDDNKCVDNTLVVKVSLTNLCNLENEYVTGSSIRTNQTKYIAFDSEERFLSQKYSPGFRKIINLNSTHVDYLSRLILPDKKKLGREFKFNILQSSEKERDAQLISILL